MTAKSYIFAGSYSCTMKIMIAFLLIFTGALRTCAQLVLQPQTLYSSDFIIDEHTRTFSFYIPEHYADTNSHPLLIFLSEDGSTAKNSIKNYGDLLHVNANSTNMVVVYPDALAGHWHTGPAKDSINDPGFLSIMIDYFTAQYQCNPRQVYVCGVGNGAAMAYQLQCIFPSKITAVAPFLYDGKETCVDNGVAVMDITANISQKPGAVAIKNMFGFFMQHVKE